MSELFYVLATVLGIGVLIFVHEAGHYLVARMIGVRVLVFSMGFGPRLWGFVRNGTDYRLAAVPLGGYVRVAGDEPDEHGWAEEGSLLSKSVPARLLFYAGGAAMNLVFALIAFPLVFRAGVDFDAPIVGGVVRGEPAWEADLRPGDRILDVEGKGMYSFQNMGVEIALAGDRDVLLRIKRGEEILETSVRPRYDDTIGAFRIGVLPPLEPWIVIEVEAGSPAHVAGVRSGDHLVAIDGEAVTPLTWDTVLNSNYDKIDEITVEVVRGTEGRKTFTYRADQDLRPPRIGVVPSSRLVVGMRPGLAPLDSLGLQRGDRVLEIDGKPFAGTGLEPFSTGPDQLTVTVLRGGKRLELGPRPVTAAERGALSDHLGLDMDRVRTAIVPQAGSPADRAGLRAGDEIKSIDGNPIGSWSDLVAAVQSTPSGATVRVVVAGSDGDRECTIIPATRRDPGLQLLSTKLRERYHKDSVTGALQAGMVCSIDLIKQLYVTLKKLFTGEVAASNLGGIITISRVTYSFAQSGWERLLYFLALLSINLAFINVLPIPVLDGGHMMFIAIEGIKGSPVSPRVLNYSQILGLVFIVALLVFVTYNDILRLL